MSAQPMPGRLLVCRTMAIAALLLAADIGPADAAGPVAAPTPPLADIVAVPVGPGQASWLAMGAEFVGSSSGFVPLRTGFAAELACAVGSGQSAAVARLPLPDGALIQGVDMWRYDASDLANLSVSLWQHCRPPDGAGNDSQLLIIASTPAVQPPGYASSTTSGSSIPVDALQCSYFIQINFGTGCPGGPDLRLLGVRVRWRTE